ncbi:UDP-glucose dehydrogenase family protein [Sphingomonas cavernae]|nr:UDP-glucose/GDP-mannose dehydrogenase family protein [Sphingomonas cavernae]
MNISIIGTGYVGLVSGACLAQLGHKVVCVDQLTARVVRIAGGNAPFFEPGLEQLVADTVASGALSATVDLVSAVQQSEITLIAVGTPDADGHIDLSQIEAASAAIGQALKNKPEYHVVAVKSTVVPGTTDGVVRTALEHAAGKSVGAEIGLCMNPEFLREGTAIEDFMTPDRIVIGASDANAASVMQMVYAAFDCPKVVMSLRNAEFTKYASNALLATLISFSNELASLCEQTPGADAEVVMDGLHLDKRLSPVVDGHRVRPGILSYLRPSSGYGGSCLPKDVAALLAYARGKNVATPLLEAVAQVNAARTGAVLDLAEERIGAFAGQKVGVLGLAFKSGTDDLRHSPAIQLVEQLSDRGAHVTVYDPVATDLARPLLNGTVKYAGCAVEALEGGDVAIIGTAWPEWSELDWPKIRKAMRGNVIFDARNSLRTLDPPKDFILYQIGNGG